MNELYDLIKGSLKANVIKVNEVADFADLLQELVARTKEVSSS